MKDDTEKISGAIEGCKQELIEASRKQEFTAKGVQLLCGVMQESLPDGRYKKELKSFLNGGPGMLPPSSTGTGLRRSRSDGSHRSERKAIMGGEAGDGAGGASESDRTPRRLFVDQQHRDQYGSNQDENSDGEAQVARYVRRPPTCPPVRLFFTSVGLCLVSCAVLCCAVLCCAVVLG